MNARIVDWAIRNSVSHAALAELRGIFEMCPPTPNLAACTKDESFTQSIVRLEAARKGLKLWRNNVGVMMNENGQPVRFGLANDSKQLNEKVKSGDLIGWRPVIITPSMVGGSIAQFVSRECKRMGWNYTGTDRESAQLRWAEAVNADGGDASFTTGEGTL